MRIVRLISVIGLLGLGVGAAVALVARVRRRARVPAAPAPSPPGASLRADLDEAEAAAGLVSIDDVEVLARDVGDLYGDTPPAGDRDAAAEEGASWLDALATSAIEQGAEPGRELAVLDDDDRDASRPDDSRDIPVADRGAGGPAGV
jgi:hypothetical protein